MLQQPASLPPPSVSRPWAADDAPPLPPIAERAKWQQERPHEMRPWDRPGVLSRTNVTRPIFLAQRPEIQVDSHKSWNRADCMARYKLPLMPLKALQ